jgi:hypothetical protein
MGFWMGLAMGVAAGVALIVAFARCENSRAARRRQLVTKRLPPPTPLLLPRISSICETRVEQRGVGAEVAPSPYVPFAVGSLSCCLR